MKKKTNKKKANRIQTTEQDKAIDKAIAEPILDRLVDDIVRSGQQAAQSSKGKPKPHQSIKLGVDVHLDRYVVVRQIDGGAPQPPQRFSPVQFLQWAQKQTELAEQVYCCYEAGPFGYRLHRKLTALGITNYVVRPRDWDEYGKQACLPAGRSRPTTGTPRNWCCIWIVTSAAIPRRFVWCACPRRRRSRSAAARASGRASRRSGSA